MKILFFFLILKHFLEIMFIESNDQHDSNPSHHSDDLQSQFHQVQVCLCVMWEWMRVTRVQFWHHVHQGDVQEDAGCGAEDPTGQVFDVAKAYANYHSDEGQHWAGIRNYGNLKIGSRNLSCFMSLNTSYFNNDLYHQPSLLILWLLSYSLIIHWHLP